MKKLIFTLVLAFSASLITHAQPVYSNVVGMVKVEIPPGGLFLGTYNMDTSGGELITDIIGTDLPAGTTLFVWDRAIQEYKLPAPVLTENPFTSEKTWSRTDISVLLGDAFFIKNGDLSNPATVIFSGSIPDDVTPVIVSNVRGFVGYPFPSEVNWTDTQLSKDVPSGSTLFIWDPVAGSYILPGPVKSVNPFTLEATWSSDPIIKPGYGIWLSVDGLAPNVTENSPYNLN